MKKYALIWYEALAAFLPEVPVGQLAPHATDELYDDYVETCEHVLERLAVLSRAAGRPV